MRVLWRISGFFVAAIHGGYALMVLGSWLGFNATPQPGDMMLFVAFGTTCIYFMDQAFPSLTAA